MEELLLVNPRRRRTRRYTPRRRRIYRINEPDPEPARRRRRVYPTLRRYSRRRVISGMRGAGLLPTTIGGIVGVTTSGILSSKIAFGRTKLGSIIVPIANGMIGNWALTKFARMPAVGKGYALGSFIVAGLRLIKSVSRKGIDGLFDLSAEPELGDEELLGLGEVRPTGATMAPLGENEELLGLEGLEGAPY